MINDCQNISLDECKNRWFQIINDETSYYLTDIDGLMIYSIKKTFPNGKTENIDIKGTDGVIPTSSTYDSFDLDIEFYYRGADKQDVDLFIFRLNNMLNVRKSYYVRHSDLPGIKYAVEPTPEIDTEFVSLRDTIIKVSFSCYKGYSESYKLSSEMSKSNGTWQFQEGVLTTDEIKYTHYDWGFRIYNGSNDTINPFNHHLVIDIWIDAPNGFSLRNNTTGDEFEYYEPLKSNTQLKIDRVYPILNLSENVGRYTNFEWITLAPGWNDIEFIGVGLESVKSVWNFNYIFR